MGKPLSIRLSEDERAALERSASAAGMKPSAYVRQLLRDDEGSTSDRLDDHERRIARLEEVAGL